MCITSAFAMCWHILFSLHFINAITFLTQDVTRTGKTTLFPVKISLQHKTSVLYYHNVILTTNPTDLSKSLLLLWSINCINQTWFFHLTKIYNSYLKLAMCIMSSLSLYVLTNVRYSFSYSGLQSNLHIFIQLQIIKYIFSPNPNHKRRNLP